MIFLPPAGLPFRNPLVPLVEEPLKVRSEVFKLGWRFGN